MKKNQLLLFALSVMISTSCVNKVKYLDNDLPDLIPKKYAVGIINIDGRYQQNITMSPDGSELLFTQTDSALWRYERIIRVRNLGQNRIVVDTPQFVKDFKYERVWMIGEPMISLDNKDLYFVADYPPAIWNSRRTPSGDWSSPIKMDTLSGKGANWYVTVSINNTLYFTNDTVFKSPLQNGKHNSRLKVDGLFNKKQAVDPFISQNEDYIIYASTREGGYGQSDLYISFNDGKGNWSDGYNLGSDINTKFREFAPYISPDGKYLFFSRRDKWQNASFSDIYWVSTKVIERIKEKRNL